MTQRIAVDFDGTLTQGEARFWEGEEPTPNEDVIEWVRTQYHSGHTVFVWTARPERIRPQTEKFLREHDVPFHALVMDKLSADTYLDDKAKYVTEITHE